MSRDQFREDLVSLGLESPGLRATGHTEARRMLREWQEGELRAAWKSAATQHHPDKNPGDAGARSRFEACAAAYDRLKRLEIPPPTRPRSALQEIIEHLASVPFPASVSSASRRGRRSRFNAGEPRRGDPVTFRVRSAFDPE